MVGIFSAAQRPDAPSDVGPTKADTNASDCLFRGWNREPAGAYADPASALGQRTCAVPAATRVRNRAEDRAHVIPMSSPREHPDASLGPLHQLSLESWQASESGESSRHPAPVSVRHTDWSQRAGDPVTGTAVGGGCASRVLPDALKRVRYARRDGDRWQSASRLMALAALGRTRALEIQPWRTQRHSGR